MTTTTTDTARNDQDVPRMLPREHGAWGQLMMPLVTGLVLGRGAFASWAFVTAAMLAFVAHEPLLVALGHRGTRARTRYGALAWRRFALRGAAALGVGLGAWWAVGHALDLAVGVALVMVALSAPFVLSKRERTTLGEVVLASTMGAASLPVAIAGGASLRAALVAWGLWSLHGLLATLAVRGLILRHRKGSTAKLARAGAAAGALALAGAAVVGATNPWLILAMVPCGLFAVGIAARPVAATQLRRVGWVLVASSVLTATGIGLGVG